MELLHLAILVCCVYLITGDPNCDKMGLLLYEELGCNPVFAEDNNSCPISYDCKKYERSLQQCTYQGRTYFPGEDIDKDILNPSCHAGCQCVNKTNHKCSIQCAILDCPEYMEPPLDSDCFYSYSLNTCCSEKIICEPFDGLAVCEVDGSEYYEGQRFNPSGTCMNCVCQKGFNGKYEAPFCTRKKCGFEIRHAEAVEQNCAPVYFVSEGEEALCCPQNFICPLETDEIIARPNAPQNDGICKFGDKSIKFDEKIVRYLYQWGKTRTVECVCDVPPLLTCTAPY
ncbi:PREDICTED: protein NEL-like [Nicrophorus vespilloides]|uniref:Protein NEL-like n=1 Tax=Nicrophorus vespilloides TaxID=110193 RepID=A0ABM1MSY9_NICVS|nr:PREDICTED: protein NEL-like [Nicrophorus vespilloides]